MPGPLVLLGWADITQMLDQVIHAKPQSDALPVYVPASMMPRVREVQAGLNESLVQMPWLDPVVSAPAQPYSADQAEELREALAKRLFDAWQATPHCELDGEHTLRWGELAPAYQAAWVAVADAALSHPAQPAPAQPQGPYSADQAKELREAAQRLITAAETAAKHFGYARLGGVSLEDSHVRSELHAWVADLRAALDAPAQPQGAGSLHGRPVRIAEVVSSSDPSKTVPWLAHGFVEITKVQAHSDFVRWLDAAQPQGAVDMQMRRPPRQPMR